MPLRYKKPPVTFHQDAASFAEVKRVDWEKVFVDYDYIWCCRAPRDYREFLAWDCTLIAEKGSGTLWRVDRMSKAALAARQESLK